MTDRNALSPQRPIHRLAVKGFSLIEVLISMVLALITFLIMFQMFESWDRNKRSTASGGGAMVTGALAMFRLERDLRLAGFGFGNAAELGCTVTGYYSTRPTAAASGAISATDTNHIYTFPLTPFQIIDGASGAPDQLVVLYGSSEGISATRYFGTGAAGAQSYTLATTSSAAMDIGGRGGIQMGDLAVVAQNDTTCNLVEVTDNTNSDRVTVNFSSSGTYEHYYTKATTSPRYNSPAGMTVAAPPSDRLPNVYVLGPTPQRRVWQIRDGRTLSFANDFWTDNVNNTSGAAGADGVNDVPFTDIADNIVNLQAQYGIATPAGSAAEAICNPVTNPTWTATAPTTACLPFVWAVRVALLTRSDQFERAWGVTSSGGAAVAPTWAGGSFTMANIDGTADGYTTATLTNPSKNPNDWRHYRYRVFESIIPLKNVMWGSR